MANLDFIKQRLNALTKTGTDGSKKNNDIWRPDPGENIIRIVPYKYNADNPFIELYFHYDIGARSYLSPSSFGKPDPIVEFAEKLKETRDKDDFLLARKIEPKFRVYGY